MTAYILCAAAYVAGSIPFGMVLARVKGIDLRQVGSGNIGATNVARAMGKGWAVAVLAADAAKGFVPVLLGRRLGLSATAIACAGAAAIVGHMFTVFLRGRGGKGVATSLGVSMALSPIAAAVGFGAYVVVFAATRLSSLGSLLGVWTFALLFALRERPPLPLIVLAIGGAALVTLRHHENIARLVRGEEKRT
jgi:acyl phosphate:glycerol-3-phosphate acyltransferase